MPSIVIQHIIIIFCQCVFDLVRLGLSSIFLVVISGPGRLGAVITRFCDRGGRDDCVPAVGAKQLRNGQLR